jgi:hypothetical protein
MANVVECPNCHYAVREAESTFTGGKEPHTFVVTHATCGHTWTAHHRDFFPEGGPPPRKRNPFDQWT